jgi:hypothetical protein
MFSCKTMTRAMNHAMDNKNTRMYSKDCSNKRAIALFLYRLFYEEQGLSLMHVSTECHNHRLTFVLSLK